MTKPERIARAGALVLAPRRDLCLDFANTLGWRGSAPSETLHGLPDLAAVGCILGQSVGGRDRRNGAWGSAAWAERHPAEAAAIFLRTIATWETIYRIFHAVASGGAPGDDDLLELNRALQETPARSALQRSARASAGGSRRNGRRPRRRCWPRRYGRRVICWPDRNSGRVRECANDKCLWLFLDESKNGTRRWCSMSACGNRAKAHRHYARLKGG